MALATPLIQRWAFSIVAGLFVLAPGALFVSAAHAANDNPTQTSRRNSGTPNSTIVIKNQAGTVIEYGNQYITYTAPPSKLDNLGEALYMENCASCHGTQADGIPANGTLGAYPDLVGLGPA